MSQWKAAALQPPHFAAIIPLDGENEHYREISRHGGILCTFWRMLFNLRIARIQHGNGTIGLMDPWINEPAAGPETLSEEELTANREDVAGKMKIDNLDDEYHPAYSTDLTKITVPPLSAASWSGWGLHPRGNFEGYLRSSSKKKWLEGHGGRHEELFMVPEAVALQKCFLDFYLKGIDNRWEDEPPVLLNVRHPGEVFVQRKEHEWPLARTQWTPLFLDAASKSASWQELSTESKLEFAAMSEGLTFFTAPLETTTEIIASVATKLYVTSTTVDADFFVMVRAFDADNQEVWFQSALDPCTPIAQGCSSASHRRFGPARSTPYQPYHSHNQIEPLTPGIAYEIEIGPTSIVLPAGFRVAITLVGQDFVRGASGPDDLANKGSGPFLHNHLDDRPVEIYGERGRSLPAPQKLRMFSSR